MREDVLIDLKIQVKAMERKSSGWLCRSTVWYLPLQGADINSVQAEDEIGIFSLGALHGWKLYADSDLDVVDLEGQSVCYALKVVRQESWESEPALESESSILLCAR